MYAALPVNYSYLRATIIVVAEESR